MFIRAIGYLLLAIASLAIVWTIQGWRYEAKIKTLELEHGKTVTNQLIQNLTKSEEYRQLERDLATALTKVSGYYQERITDVEKDKASFIAGVRNGTIKLRDPYKVSTRAGGSISTEALNPASRRNAETGCELSAEASEFLYAEASRADKIVEQLGACQGVVEKYLNFLGNSS